MSRRSTRGASAEPAALPAADPAALARHRALVLLRAVDTASSALDAQGLASVHLPLRGLEAVLVGVAAALAPADWVLPGPRQSAVALARGVGPGAWFAQALGRSADPARGRQVPQHGSWRSVHVVSASTPIGSQLVHAVGVARGMQQAGRGEVAVALAGQAAVATGDFHCALNFAAVQDAPAIFVLTSDERLGDHTATAGIAPKAAAYGLPGVVVDGGDVDAVLDAVARARERARSGAGPTLVEAVVPTPPPCGPTAGPRPLGAPWDDVDPVARHERRLLHAGLLAPEAADDARRHAKDAVASAVTWARALPPPPGDTLVADVFARPTPALAAQRDLWRAPRAARQET